MFNIYNCARMGKIKEPISLKYYMVYIIKETAVNINVVKIL